MATKRRKMITVITNGPDKTLSSPLLAPGMGTNYVRDGRQGGEGEVDHGAGVSSAWRAAGNVWIGRR